MLEQSKSRQFRPSPTIASTVPLLGFFAVFVVAATLVQPLWLRIGLLCVDVALMGMWLGILVARGRNARAADADGPGGRADGGESGWLPSRNGASDGRDGLDRP